MWGRQRPGNHGDRSVIGPGMILTGRIESNSTGPLEIRGRVCGDIVHNGLLIITREGRCTSNIRARSLRVWGEVHGDLVAADLLELMETARVVGDVVCKRLKIHPGAIFQGATRMEVQGSDPAAPGLAEEEGAPPAAPFSGPVEAAQAVTLPTAPSAPETTEADSGRGFEAPSFLSRWNPAASRR